MKRAITILTLGFITFSSNIYGQINKENTTDSIKTTKTCSSTCKAENKSGELACKLTTPELQKRKETVLKSLKTKIVEKKELENGYAYKFPGTDELLDELTEFIKQNENVVAFSFLTFQLVMTKVKLGWN